MWCALALALSALGACGGDEDAAKDPAADDGAARALAAIEASPCDIAAAWALSDSAIAAILTGEARIDAEVGDCQRLVMSAGPGGEFGPLVGLFPLDATLELPRADYATPLPAAAIYSWGAAGGGYPAAYPALGLGVGAHCLWMRNVGDGAGGWRATIVAGAGCGRGVLPPPDSAFALPVFERTYADTDAADYPRTARWEWDLDSGSQLIGLKCGDAWCAVMAGGGAPPRTQPLEGGMLVAREKVPGWSDAQHLAVFDSAAGRARPGPWGAVVAYPGIAAAAPAWVEGLLAARITVFGTAGRFADRFYLQPEGDSGHDDLILRFPGMQDEAWLQQGPMRRRKARGIRFAPRLAQVVAGAVRWRWAETGESIWISCPSGVCAVAP